MYKKIFDEEMLQILNIIISISSLCDELLEHISNYICSSCHDNKSYNRITHYWNELELLLKKCPKIDNTYEVYLKLIIVNKLIHICPKNGYLSYIYYIMESWKVNKCKFCLINNYNHNHRCPVINLPTNFNHCDCSNCSSKTLEIKENSYISKNLLFINIECPNCKEPELISVLPYILTFPEEHHCLTTENT